MSTPRRNLGAAPEVAEYLDVSVQALAMMRMEGSGPEFIRVGRRIRYRWDAVDAWLDANTSKGSVAA